MRFIWTIGILLLSSALQAQDSEDRWKKTGSPETYLHHIELRDERGQIITAEDDSTKLPHMGETCGPCHDMNKASGGLHGGAGPHGSPGEPWFIVDSKTATRWPFHPRPWPGLTTPSDLGLDPEDLLQNFGAYDTGGSESMTGQASDCLICHLPDGYDFHRRSKMLDQGKSALAAFVAAGLFEPSGKPVSRLWDESGKVTLNLKGDAGPLACLQCHTSKPATANQASPHWSHADDVHLAAGMSCVDCHRAGIDHHVVRGKEGEIHPTGAEIKALSCRGCHLPDGEAVMHSAPRPEHRGLPPFHLEQMSCTACHSGPDLNHLGEKTWTSRAHQLGIPKQGRSSEDPPSIYSGILALDDQGRWAPHHQGWPEGWIQIAQANESEAVLSPAEMRTPLRRILRVRSDLLEKIANTDDDSSREERSTSAFLNQANPPTALVTGGSAWRPAPGDFLQAEPSDLAQPVQWTIGHPVRPASMSLGSQGCTDCHSSTTSWPLLMSSPDPLIRIRSHTDGNPLRQEQLRTTNVFDSVLWDLWKPIFPARDLAKFYFLTCAFLASAAAVYRFLSIMTGRHG